MNGSDRLTFAIELHKKQCANKLLKVKNEIESKLRKMIKVQNQNVTQYCAIIKKAKKTRPESLQNENISENSKVDLNNQSQYIAQQNTSSHDINQSVLNGMDSPETKFIEKNSNSELLEIRHKTIGNLNQMRKKISENCFKLAKANLEQIVLPRVVTVADLKDVQIAISIDTKLREMYKTVTQNLNSLVNKSQNLHSLGEKKIKKEIDKTLRKMNYNQYVNLLQCARFLEIQSVIKTNLSKLRNVISKNQEIFADMVVSEHENVDGTGKDNFLKKEDKIIDNQGNLAPENLTKTEEKLEEVKFKIKSEILEMKKTVNLVEQIYTRTFLESVGSIIKDGDIGSDRELLLKISHSVNKLRKMLDFEMKFDREDLTKSVIYLGIAEKYVQDVIKLREICNLFDGNQTTSTVNK